MRILLTSGIFPPDIGGPATFIPELADSLLLNKHEVTVIALRPSNYSNLMFRFKIHLINRTRLRIFRIFKTTIKIFIQLRKSEVLFSNGLYLESAIPIRVLRKRAQAKVVGDPLWEKDRNQGLTSLSLSEYQESKKSIKNSILRKLYVFALNSYEVIVCPSEELTAIVSKWGVKRKIMFVPNGVKLQIPSDAPKEYDLIYVGRLVKWKNIPILIRTANELSLKLCIVGDGPERAQLESLAKEIGSDCIFTGEVDKSSLYLHLNRARIFTLISQYEGLSYALLEAMSTGLPAIVSNANGNICVVEDHVNGRIVPLEEIESLNSCIRSLLESPDTLLKLSVGARETIKIKFLAETQLYKIRSIILGSE